MGYSTHRMQTSIDVTQPYATFRERIIGGAEGGEGAQRDETGKEMGHQRHAKATAEGAKGAEQAVHAWDSPTERSDSEERELSQTDKAYQVQGEETQTGRSGAKSGSRSGSHKDNVNPDANHGNGVNRDRDRDRDGGKDGDGELDGSGSGSLGSRSGSGSSRRRRRREQQAQHFQQHRQRPELHQHGAEQALTQHKRSGNRKREREVVPPPPTPPPPLPSHGTPPGSKCASSKMAMFLSQVPSNQPFGPRVSLKTPGRQRTGHHQGQEQRQQQPLQPQRPQPQHQPQHQHQHQHVTDSDALEPHSTRAEPPTPGIGNMFGFIQGEGGDGEHYDESDDERKVSRELDLDGSDADEVELDGKGIEDDGSDGRGARGEDEINLDDEGGDAMSAVEDDALMEEGKQQKQEQGQGQQEEEGFQIDIDISNDDMLYEPHNTPTDPLSDLKSALEVAEGRGSGGESGGRRGGLHHQEAFSMPVMETWESADVSLDQERLNHIREKSKGK